jgi:3-deoxy-7-phosphoheptulonate synthase / chorismate mutase
VSEPDPILRELRDKISGTDRTILQAVNARLELVAQIKAYKESRSIEFLDPEREQAMLEELVAANTGPLSAEGVRELLSAILNLSKRELA